MSPRTKALLSGAATVVVVAAVILGLWAFGSARKMTPPTITYSPQQRSNQAYEDGLAALSKEQTDTATELFQNAITINPDNAAAKEALAKLKSGNSSPGSTTTTTSTNPGSTTPTKTVNVAPPTVWETKLDIAKLLPKSFPDYALGGIDKAGSDAQVSASPSKVGATITSVVWAVHDLGTDGKAADFITRTSKSQYSHDAKTITVNGAQAYYGTDGTRFVTVAYVRGRYVFELLVTTSAAPSSAASFAEQAAAAFATTP